MSAGRPGGSSRTIVTPDLSKGACAGTYDLMFPHAEDHEGKKAAKAVCAGCHMVVECLEYALQADERYGIWGGTSPTKRRWMRRRRTNPTNGSMVPTPVTIRTGTARPVAV